LDYNRRILGLEQKRAIPMCSEVQSIAQHTICSALEINNLEIKIRCTRDNIGYTPDSGDEDLNRKCPVITRKQTKPRPEIPKKVAIAKRALGGASRQKPLNRTAAMG